MKQLIREFGQKLKGGAVGVFYYAGHGVQSKGRNYLIPVDADIQSETDVEDLSVDVNLLLGLMDEAGNGLNIVILDACRNNPFARSFRSATNGLAQIFSDRITSAQIWALLHVHAPLYSARRHKFFRDRAPLS